jgi:hypothetical protein
LRLIRAVHIKFYKLIKTSRRIYTIVSSTVLVPGSAVTASLGSCADCNFRHLVPNEMTVHAAASAIATINAVWMPSTYARRMNGMSLAAKVDRTSVAPVPMTLRGSTEGSVWRSFFVRTDSKAASPAETRKAPPMVCTTRDHVSIIVKVQQPRFRRLTDDHSRSRGNVYLRQSGLNSRYWHLKA